MCLNGISKLCMGIVLDGEGVDLSNILKFDWKSYFLEYLKKIWVQRDN